MDTNIKEVKKRHEMALIKIAGVEGIGIGKKWSRDCFVLYTSKKTKSFVEKLPKNIEGYPVILKYSGTFKAY